MPGRPSNLVPILVLLGAVLLGLLLWWCFPALMGFVSRQDCLASGRITGC